MILRKLLFVALVVGFGWVLRRLFSAASRVGRSASAPRPAAGPGPTTVMVRDRVCNTYLPRDRALAESVAGVEHWFCSDRCRRQFLADATRPEAEQHASGSRA